ncbi:Pentulose kinase [Pluteus cervinus]|uniref:Pentulose kinase n=1 Tax=Pluteus cervinus TaxID=181527 RepID=A0ACD3B961_9AGAR|nr:Pentulose kinase [Pluteus cervinus]
MSPEAHYIGVDVGTGSARASLIKKDGTVVASHLEDTLTFRDAQDHRIFEQSTTNIWSAIATSIKKCLQESQVPASAVKGLGFDATCSLAVTDLGGGPITVTKGSTLGQHGDQNIILWADHRAEEEADIINKTGSVVLNYVGGTMSLEMEVPKILWLKRRMDPSLFSRCQFFDLPDYLTYRATSDSTRSTCSVTCKCSFLPEGGWQSDFFRAIGLGELQVHEYKQIGGHDGDVLIAGLPVSSGLSKKAAEELGLEEGTPVGSALIDAYAGWLGTVAARYKENGTLAKELPSVDESQRRLAVIAGTSTCHIVQSRDDHFVRGVWGPYKDPVFRGWWMNEGGQSSTGQLIDFILTTHPAYPQLVETAKAQGKDIHNVLDELLESLKIENKVDSLTELTKDLHIYPDFHGNRSPIADPRMRGSITGLEINDTLTDLARKYHATLEGIALQTRHIIEELNAKGHQIQSIYMSGGQARNLSLMNLFANSCNMPVVLPASDSNSVILGAAMLGRLAAEATAGLDVSDEKQAEALWNVMVEMTPPGTRIVPSASEKEQRILAAKYKIFRETIEIQKRWREEIEEAVKG